jgi:hypothetical protein
MRQRNKYKLFNEEYEEVVQYGELSVLPKWVSSLVVREECVQTKTNLSSNRNYVMQTCNRALRSLMTL